MIYIPQKEIDFAGGIDSLISHQEMQALRHSLFEKPIKEAEAPVTIYGDLSFVGDDCWIQNTSIRENILFGLEFDKRRYVKVCLACKLETDFLQFAEGDMTQIGDQGI